MKNNEIHLSELTSSLKHAHVKLDLDFLSKLLQSASKSDKPHRNLEFANFIGCPVNKTKKSATTIKGWMTGYRTIPMSKLIKIVELSNHTWQEVANNLISIKAGIRRGEIKPKFPIVIDSKIGSILGHILGDGSIDKYNYSVFFSNSNVELLKEFRDCMKEIFGIEPRIWIQKEANFGNTQWLRRTYNFDDIPKGNNVGLFYPKICTEILYVLFGRFAEGKVKMITPQIKNFNLEFKKGLVRAFFDCEGSIRADSRTARFHQDNREILEGIRLILKELGVNSHEIKFYLKRNKLRYYFNICGFKEYHTFHNLIGCTSTKKAKQFELLINKVQNSKYFKKKFALLTCSE